ncbi:MAG TPA: hypothetical protein VFS92_11415, partial [Planctomycetota bacterium]|nr:hypothetical protein [Planctomycetota bacterium]
MPDPRGSGDHQIILAPMAQEVRWVLARHRGKAGLTDGGFDGVEVAGRETRDEQGSYRGYSFEAALPLSNFPGFEPAGGSLGFNLALVDADGAPGQKSYLLWAGSVPPAWDPSALGTLRFEGTPGSIHHAAPPAAGGGGPGLGDWKVPGAIVLGALLLLALLHLARRPLQHLGDLPVRRKIALAAALALLVAGARLIPGLVRWRREGQAVARLEESRERLLRLADDARKALVLGPRRPGESDSALVALLAGGRALPRPEFRATPLPAVPVAPRQTRGGGVPVRDTRIPLAGLGRVAFRLPELPDAASMTAVIEWRPPAPGRPRPPAGAVVGRIAAIGADGTASSLDIRLGREVDEGGPLEGDAHAATEAKVAWTEGDGGAHADEVSWKIAGAPRRLQEVAAEQLVPDGLLVIRGVTVHPADGSAPRPAPLGRTTRDGVPTTAWNGAPAGESLRVGPRAQKGLVPIDAEGDEVFVVCAAPAGFPPEKAGRPAASLALVLEDGTRPPPVTLVLGEDLDAERLAGLDHPEGFRRGVAFRWPGASGETLHRDLVALPVPGAGGARVLALEVESLDPETEFVVDAVTVVRRLARPPPTGLTALQRQGDGYQVAPATAAALEGLAVTHYRGGRAAATTMPEGLRDRVLGTEAPPELPPPGSSGLPEGVYGRAVGGRAFLARQARLPFGDADEVLEVAVPAPDARDLDLPVAAATALLLLLAVPLVLAAALDALERLPHLRWKLVGAFGIAAVLPLVGLTLVLARHFEDQVDRGVERELRAHADAASRALLARRDEARRLAEECVRDEALRRALAVPEEGARAAQVDAVVRSLAARTPGARVALEVVPAGGAPAGRLT